jgi:ribosomal protein S18 acetylase RimI-like enzyme
MSRFDLISAHVAQYLANFRLYYPGIFEWYFGLEDDFASGQRRMFVSWNGSNVDGLAITKNGHRAKLCHISVSPAARDCGLGWTLAGLALSDMVHYGAQEIRVTTSEEVFYRHASFFRAIGFSVVDWQVHRYRHDVSELVWKLEVEPAMWRSKKCLSPALEHGIVVFGVGSPLRRLPL